MSECVFCHKERIVTDFVYGDELVMAFMDMEPINYGYVEGIMALDGEEQDTYILGVDEAVEKVTGKIIAIVHRHDDVEEKWVVALEGMIFTKEEIKEKIHFQEQYFDSEIVM